MKRTMALILSLAMMLVILTGCGGNSTSGNTGTGSGTQTTTGTQSGGTQTTSTATTVLQLGHIDPSTETDAYQIFSLAFKKYVNELSNGTMDIDVKGDAQLGSETEMFEALALGDLDMGIITNNLYANFVKDFEIFDLPFLFKDYETSNSVVDDPEIFGFLQNELLQANGIRILTYGDTGYRYIVNNVRPIVNVEDLKGIKIRLPEAALFIDTFKALGANPTSMAFSEAYTAVQQGTVDGLEITASAIYSSGYYEICKYLSKTGHFESVITLDMSEAVWSKLTEEQQNVLMEAANKASKEARQQVYANENKFLDEMAAAGCQVNDISDPAEFRAAAQSVYDKAQTEVSPELWNMVMSKIG